MLELSTSMHRLMCPIFWPKLLSSHYAVTFFSRDVGEQFDNVAISSFFSSNTTSIECRHYWKSSNYISSMSFCHGYTPKKRCFSFKAFILKGFKWEALLRMSSGAKYGYTFWGLSAFNRSCMWWEERRKSSIIDLLSQSQGRETTPWQRMQFWS